MSVEDIVQTTGVTRTFELYRCLVLDNVSLGLLPPGPPEDIKGAARFSLSFADPDGTENFGSVGPFLRIRMETEPGQRLSNLVDGVFGWRCTGAPGWRAMLLHWAPLLLLGVVLGSFVLGTLCDLPSHSLRYSYLRLSEPTQELPQFFIRGYLDDQPIIRFDSLTRKMDPLVPWMEEAEKERFLDPEWVFRADLENLLKLDHHAGGLHTWQVNLGCELREDGTKGGFFHYGYDGMDFISFNKETLTWVAAQPQAEKVKQKSEDHPGWSQGNKVFLEKTCIEWLQRYLSYQKETLQRIESPEGKVTRKVVDDSLEVLICQAFGFYPKEIQATWRRDREVCQYETLHRNVAPNSDGTYYIWLSIEIDPKERDCFRCYLEHEGLREPLVLAWKEERARIWWISSGIVIAMILILFPICLWWRFRKNISQQVKSGYDFPEMAAFPLVYGKEDEIQSQTIPQTQVTVENTLKATVSKLSTKEQKHQRLTRRKL